MKRKLLIIILLVLAVIMLSGCEKQALATFSGYARDSNGEGVSGVRVSAQLQGVTYYIADTNSDGYYYNKMLIPIDVPGIVGTEAVRFFQTRLRMVAQKDGFVFEDLGINYSFSNALMYIGDITTHFKAKSSFASVPVVYTCRVGEKQTRLEFSKNEAIVIAIGNTSLKDSYTTWSVLSRATGNSVWNKGFFVTGPLSGWQSTVGQLPPGPYTAIVYVNDEQIGLFNFSVSFN